MANCTNITRRMALKALPFAVVSTAAVASDRLADQALLDLGAKFEAAYAAEEALLLASSELEDLTEWEAASAVTRQIVDEIEQMPASSLEGLQIKARCILWCSGDGSVSFGEGHTRDMRFARQIVMSLLAA